MNAANAAPTIPPTTPILTPMPIPSSSEFKGAMLSLRRLIAETAVPTTPHPTPQTTAFLNIARRRLGLFSSDIDIVLAIHFHNVLYNAKYDKGTRLSIPTI